MSHWQHHSHELACPVYVWSVYYAACRTQQDFLRADWWLTVPEPEPPLPFPRCWTHRQPCEVRSALLGADAGHRRGTDGAVCALRSSAACSLLPGISALQILQAFQAREVTAKPARSESDVFLLTSPQVAQSGPVSLNRHASTGLLPAVGFFLVALCTIEGNCHLEAFQLSN